jgi:hypothetical protein
MTNEAPPAWDASATSQAAADADRRIVALERERDALAAEVGQPLGVAAPGYPRRTVRS